MVFLFIAADRDLSFSPLVLNTVIKGIFHQGLERQLQDRILIKRRIDIDLILQNIGIAELLDTEVAPNMGFLLLNSNVIPALAQCGTEKLGEGSYHCHYLFVLSAFRHPNDCIQRII